MYAACGLYPRPIAQGADGSGVPARTLQLFGFMGKFVAKAMLDNRLVDLPFCQTFYKQLLGEPLSLADLAEVNPSLASQLQKLQPRDCQKCLFICLVFCCVCCLALSRLPEVFVSLPCILLCLLSGNLEIARSVCLSALYFVVSVVWQSRDCQKC